MGDLHVRFEVAFGRGLWLRMKAMNKRQGGMILLEGYDTVNQWCFAGKVDGYVVKEDDWVDGEHGAPRISQKWITVRTSQPCRNHRQ